MLQTGLVGFPASRRYDCIQDVIQALLQLDDARTDNELIYLAVRLHFQHRVSTDCSSGLILKRVHFRGLLQ
jgi:hypothetical protein